MLGKTNWRFNALANGRAASQGRFDALIVLSVAAMLIATPILSGCGSAAATIPTSTFNVVASPASTHTSTSKSASPTAALATSQRTLAISTDRTPVTITASGIAVTLEFVDTIPSATRFNFSVTVPTDDVSQQFDRILGSDPTNDILINGHQGRPEPITTVVDTHGPGWPMAPLSLAFSYVFPTNQTVTVTISKLWLSTREVDGPWTFHITPTMLTSQKLPAPDIGTKNLFSNISVTEAQRLISFPIIEPKPLPKDLMRRNFTAACYALGDTGPTPANFVMLDYEPQPPPGKGVYLFETTNDAAIPTVNNGSFSMLFPGPDGTPTTISGKIAPGTLNALTIEGVDVTTFESDAITYYVWKHAGVDFFVRDIYAGVDQPNTGLLHVVTSIIDQSAGSGTPVANQQASPVATASPTGASGAFPTPDQSGGIIGITFEQAQQLTPFPIFMPTYIPPSLKYNDLAVKIPPIAPAGVRRKPQPRLILPSGRSMANTSV